MHELSAQELSFVWLRFVREEDGKEMQLYRIVCYIGSYGPQYVRLLLDLSLRDSLWLDTQYLPLYLPGLAVLADWRSEVLLMVPFCFVSMPQKLWVMVKKASPIYTFTRLTDKAMPSTICYLLIEVVAVDRQ